MSNLFIPMQYTATQAYNDLLFYYADEDYNAQYIRTFEVMLSPLLKEGFLIKDKEYRRITEIYPLPDPDDDNQYLSAEGFRLYIRTFEKVMRKYHIIGGWESDEQQDDMVSNTAVDPLLEYKK